MAPVFPHEEIRLKLIARRILGNQKLRLLTFLAQGKFSDVTIETEDEEFKAHKVILASHSPMFERMFTTDMQEAKSGVVRIKDVRSEVVGIMLRFMYSCVVVRLPELFDEIFAAAHLYDVQELVQAVVHYATTNVCAENATRILKMSRKYSLEDTESTVQKFISDNEPLMIKQDEYLVHLAESVNVDNVVKYLKLAKKYDLADLKQNLIKFVSENFKSVMELQEYRNLYRDKDFVDLIVEIDRYVASAIEKRSAQHQ